MKEEAVILAGGIYDDSHAKTAHGLVRRSSRFDLKAVIDSRFYGHDAGTLLDGIERGIPIYSSLESYVQKNDKPKYCIIGVASAGGVLSDDMYAEVKQAISMGISVVSGLHVFLSDMPELSQLAIEQGAELIDIRKPKPKNELKFWTGEIMKVGCPIVAVLGTDCALGKRTTASFLNDAFIARGNNSQMIYTGQTGWMQGHQYGFIFDSTYNDFVSGELEHAIVSCYKVLNPEVIFLEGQSALGNPSGPCGSEYILSGQAKGVILQHSPKRDMYISHEETGLKISVARDLELIRLYGGDTLAITLNTEGISLEEARGIKHKYEVKYGLPVILPIEEGVDVLYEVVNEYIKKFNEK